MNENKRVFILLFILLFTCGVVAIAQEQITLTTYYPAPFGEYETIRLMPSAIGGNEGTPCTNPGLMYNQESTNTLLYCDGVTNTWITMGGGSFWRQVGNSLYPSDLTWRVGIGTANPQSPLHVYSPGNPTTLRIQSSGAFGAGRLEFWSDPQGSANEWRPGFIQSTDNGSFTGGLGFFVNGTGYANRTGQIEAMRLANGTLTNNGSFVNNGWGFFQGNGRTLRLAPNNPNPEIGSSSGDLNFWYSGVGWNTIRVGDLIVNGNVGVGTGSPTARVSAYQNSNYSAVFGVNQGGGYAVWGENTGTSFGGGVFGRATNGSGVRGQSDSYFGVLGTTSSGLAAVVGQGPTGVWGSGSTNGVLGSGPNIGVRGEGGSFDFYAAGAGVNYGPFTGGHEVKLASDFPSNATPGMVVSVTGETRIRKDGDGNISLSSTLPTVTLSRKANDTTVFGVFNAETSLPDDHWYTASKGERFATVNALGEGRVLVTNLNGNVEVGDYITTSPIPGYGQKQDDGLLHNYTLGKVTESVDWEKVAETVLFEGKQYKIYLISVVYVSG